MNLMEIADKIDNDITETYYLCSDTKNENSF